MKNNMFDKDEEIRKVKEKIVYYEKELRGAEGIWAIGYKKSIKILEDELYDLTSEESFSEAYYRKY